MTDRRSSESRRKLLKSIAAGSGAIVAGKSLPESWTRPVVDSVMLPAHAQTSPPPPPVACSGCFLHGPQQNYSKRYTPGTYPQGTVEEFDNTSCTGTPIGTYQSVEAATQGEAATAYADAYGQCTQTMIPQPDITCANVWICFSDG